MDAVSPASVQTLLERRREPVPPEEPVPEELKGIEDPILAFQMEFAFRAIVRINNLKFLRETGKKRLGPFLGDSVNLFESSLDAAFSIQDVRNVLRTYLSHIATKMEIDGPEYLKKLTPLQRARFDELKPLLETQSDAEFKKASADLTVLEKLEVCEGFGSPPGISQSEIDELKKDSEGIVPPAEIPKIEAKFRRAKRLAFLKNVRNGYKGEGGIEALKLFLEEEVKRVTRPYEEKREAAFSEEERGELIRLGKRLKQCKSFQEKRLKQCDRLQDERETWMICQRLSVADWLKEIMLKEIMLYVLNRNLLMRQGAEEDALRTKKEAEIEVVFDESGAEWMKYFLTHPNFNRPFIEELITEFLKNTTVELDSLTPEEKVLEAKKILKDAFAQNNNPALDAEKFEKAVKFYRKLRMAWLRSKTFELMAETLVERESVSSGPREGVEHRGEGRKDEDAFYVG